VSVGTCGIATARVWHELGYDFTQKLQNGDDNVMIAIDYDFINMLQFLQQEVGLNLYCFNYGG
jgi:hypothetical protein